ncbi:MAG: hypothetical protein ACJAZN_000746, partial [Planctomycetota bacterium]
MGTSVSKPREYPGAGQRVSDTSTTGESRAARSMATMGRSVLRRATQAHYARATCGALGTFALAFACAVGRGASLGSFEAVGLAALLGLLTFAAWVRSETVSSRDVLERVDRRLHLGGAFLAAQESCERTPGSAVAQLGAARLLLRVRPSQVMEAAVPHTLGFVILPLLGLLVLVQTVQSRDARRGRAGFMNIQVGAIAAGLGNVAVEHGATLTDEQRETLAEIQKKADAAAKLAADSSLGQEPEGDSTDFREVLSEVADELNELAEEAPSGSGLADDLSDAAASAEALAMDAGAMEASAVETSAVDPSASASPSESSESQGAEAGEAEAGDGQFAGNAPGNGSGAPGDAPLGGETGEQAPSREPTSSDGQATVGMDAGATAPLTADSAGRDELGGDGPAPEASAGGESASASDPSQDGPPAGKASGESTARLNPPRNAPGKSAPGKNGPGKNGPGATGAPEEGRPQESVPNPDSQLEPVGAEAALAERRW